MQIVIDVNDELVEYFANHNSMNDDGWFSHSSQLLNAFRNGTPLQKGHGRLIDTDVLVDGMEDDYEFCEAVNATPTIIEADKEMEDD